MVTMFLVLCAALATGAADGGQAVERQHVLTITVPDLDGGILSEITWDNGALLLQGIIANPDGSLSGKYVLVPATGTTLGKLKDQTSVSMEYWIRKSRRSSPTGIGDINIGTDSKMPMAGIGQLEQRMMDAHDMGGMRKKTIVRLGRLVLHECEDGHDPYDGEIWSWSPAELNRIAYVDAKGSLWVARADGHDAQRLLKGNFTLPAWSDDGKAIAVAEKKDGGRNWDISVVLLPESLRTVR